MYFNEIDKKSLPYVGGKGANLGEMTQAGFPVPQGFCVTTAAYQIFVQTSTKMNDFLDQLDDIDADRLDEIRLIGQQIRAHLEQMPVPSEIEKTILAAWQHTGVQKAYAVRSSATAEDLPNASFAGQQETYLNVQGEAQLLDAIRRCWASLFTDRAIAYRAKNGFQHRQVHLSVVVQEMVFPEVAGIMFTADPISGNRKVTAIDASFGLGEALVSGLVSADLYHVRDGQIVQKKISKKEIAIYAQKDGGTLTKDLSPEMQEQQALPDERITQLAQLGRKIERHYGTEQDIEWCFADGQFYIVQSRPITSLYPVPSFADDQLHVMVSIGHIQMMTDAMKPMGLSVLQCPFRNFAHEVGGRLFVDVTGLLSIPITRKKVPQILKQMDEQIADALREVSLRDDIHFPTKRLPLRKMAPIALPVLSILLKNLFFVDPAKGINSVAERMEHSLQQCRKHISEESGAGRIRAIQAEISALVPRVLPKIVPYMVTGIMASRVIEKWMEKWLGDAQQMHLLNRSLPGNVTSEMGLLLGDLADIARQHPSVVQYLQTANDADFAAGLDAIPGGDVFRQAFERFMQRYGMRCPGEIDITRPRWRETPTALVPAIMSHIRTVGLGEHRANFAQGASAAEAAAKEIIAKIRAQKGAFKARMMSRMLNVYRNLGGLREHHKYLLIQHMGIYKQAIVAEAHQLVTDGVLDQTSDVFYLTLDELGALLAGHFTGDVLERIKERKTQYVYQQKLTPPRVMTSDGEVIHGRRRGVKAPAGALTGTPVSAGVVEGYAKVVLQPETAELNPGEIMIAPFTDPGWTPLFHSAKGLVMEVGGQMTHGAVVAREYGIPAVVGIGGATKTIKDGAYIRVDGTQGYVQILREAAND